MQTPKFARWWYAFHSTLGRIRHVAALASFAVLAACGGTDLIVDGGGSGAEAHYRWAHLNPSVITSAAPLAHSVDSVIPSALGVQVVDENGAPFDGLTIVWSVSSGGAVSSGASGPFASVHTAQLDAEGRSTVYWRTGTDAVTQTLTAAVSGPSGSDQDVREARFQVAAKPGPPRTISVAPSSLRLEQGSSAGLSARVFDRHGNLVDVDNVAWVTRHPQVASIDANGMVTGVRDGRTFAVVSFKSAIDSASVEVFSVSQSEPEPGTLAVTPSSVQLDGVGSTAQLSVVARAADGSVIGQPNVLWSSSNTSVATVTSSGLVTAAGAGTAEIGVTALCCSAAAALITVTQPPDPGTLEVTPSSVQLEGVGSTAQLVAVARDAGGSPIALPEVQWQSLNTSVATISASGLITARGAGTTQIEVTASCCESTSATVTVTVPSSTRTVYVREGFEDRNFSSRGWFANLNLITTTSQAHSGNSALEVHFARGASNPDHGSAARIQFPETETVYVSYWVKYSSSWVGSGRAYHPHEFQFTTNKDDRWVGPAVTRLTTYVEHNYRQGALYPRLAMQDAANIDQSRIGVDLTTVTENRAAGGCNGETDGYKTGCYSWGGSYRNEKVWVGADPALTDSDKNAWHHVEAVFELNSVTNGVGQSDGVARYWIDGRPLLDVRNVLFRTGQHPDMAFWEFLIGIHIGDGSPVDQTMWIDDLLIADRR